VIASEASELLSGRVACLKLGRHAIGWRQAITRPTTSRGAQALSNNRCRRDRHEPRRLGFPSPRSDFGRRRPEPGR
jgi:hypothetical protein